MAAKSQAAGESCGLHGKGGGGEHAAGEGMPWPIAGRGYGHWKMSVLRIHKNRAVFGTARNFEGGKEDEE
ncbi:MAG: hypothetical protein HFH80_06960 [Lachnospiraceae bacterium]|nr:hypothetical protein [Lachnospiraceae bacterium]